MTANFRSPAHALFTGTMLGHLMHAYANGTDSGTTVEPLLDADGNYLPYIRVQLPTGRRFLINVDEETP